MTAAGPAGTAPRPAGRRITAGRVALLLSTIAGSYWVANVVTGWLARLLVAAAGWQNGEATILSCLIGIIVCAALVVWVFAHRSPIRACLALLAWGAIATGVGWVVPDSFGLVAMGPPA
jgi:hypothetical protein